MCDNDQECTPVVPGSITPEPLPNPGGGGGGGTTDFNQLTNRPKYGGVRMSGTTDIPNIEGLIPSTATSANKLADQAFVNSSVATNTAYFVGTFNTIEELEAVENPSNNDYGFVITTDSAGNTVYNRYKFNSDTNAWVFEYALNNSSFTAAQWAAIQSGITSDGVDKLEALALIESIGEGLNLDANGELSFDKNLIGKAKVLTEDDYNYPVDNPTYVALWLLEPGMYSWSNLLVHPATGTNAIGGGAIVFDGYNTTRNKLIYYNSADGWKIVTVGQAGEPRESVSLTPIDYLTSTSTTSPLSAKQGKVLKDMIDALPTGGVTELTADDYNYPADNPNRVALWLLEPGIYYAGAGVSVRVNSSTNVANAFYIVTQEISDYKSILVLYPTALGGTVYNVLVSNGLDMGSSSITTSVVQTTGTSTTDVMSQNATTSMVFADPSTKNNVQIGASTTSSGPSATAIGSYAQASGIQSVSVGRESVARARGAVALGYNALTEDQYAAAIGADARAAYKNSIALGGYSQASAVGEVNIGTPRAPGNGYNNSAYRLLTGLYDPQSAHDAATKGYVDATTDSAAPTTSTVGRLGEIKIDTTTDTAYMCVKADTVTPEYTWKQITT